MTSEVRAFPRPLLFLLTAVSLLGTGCSAFLGDGADRADLIETLRIQADLSLDDAVCVTAALYDDSGLTEEQIHDFSIGNYPPDHEDYQRYLQYTEAVDTAVNSCLG